MLTCPTHLPIYFCTEPVDFRKSFDGLTGVITSVFGRSVLDGHLFLFINKRRDRIKAMWWDRDGTVKDTINRLSHKTAAKALEETLPRGEKPLQLLTTGNTVRSVHGVAYTRLWNADLLDAVRDAAPDFQPPQTAMDGHSTGLYCGEQDMFAFLVDPLGWVEIDSLSVTFAFGECHHGKED